MRILDYIMKGQTDKEEYKSISYDTPKKDKITLNEYLLKADVRCIQYVILHELTHLIYPNQVKSFMIF